MRDAMRFRVRVKFPMFHVCLYITHENTYTGSKVEARVAKHFCDALNTAIILCLVETVGG